MKYLSPFDQFVYSCGIVLIILVLSGLLIAIVSYLNSFSDDTDELIDKEIEEITNITTS